MIDNTPHFHHVGIVVPDLERAIDFYCEVFGYNVLQRIDWDDANANLEWPKKVIGIPNSIVRGVQLQGKNGFLELFEWLQPEATGNPAQANSYGITHIAFQVTDIMTIYEHFLAAGGTAHGEPFPVGKAIAIYCRDPFGNLIELLEIVQENAPFDLRRL